MNENVAVVLGAGPGLGFSLAKRWAQEGYTVVIMARDHARITQAAHQLTERGLKAYAQVIDCADNDSIRTALAKVPIVDASAFWMNRSPGLACSKAN